MPLIEASVSAGRTPEQIRALVSELHAAVERTINAKPEHITVIVREIPRAHWAKGDATLAEMDARVQ
ncbi:tautomerase family protein [Arthrobacter sp. 35W]|uniref:tautomerase family protein n=1 Tax=Arthrobacter sp. 35W TaxID=1132441 RepID=UPI0003F56CEE|nr:tautomerase family protein [Arthrobacter sp. 35W]